MASAIFLMIISQQLKAGIAKSDPESAGQYIFTNTLKLTNLK